MQRDLRSFLAKRHLAVFLHPKSIIHQERELLNYQVGVADHVSGGVKILIRAAMSVTILERLTKATGKNAFTDLSI